VKLFLLFQLILSFTVSFAADYPHGEWRGTGHYKNPKKEGDCTSVEMRFDHRGETLILRGGGYTCGEIVAEYPYSKFKIDGSFIYYEGEQVGLISKDSLSIVYWSQGYQLHLFLKEDGSMSYTEMWTDGTADFLKIKARLYRQDNDMFTFITKL